MEYVSYLTAPGVDDRMSRAGDMSIGHQVVQYQRNLEHENTINTRRDPAAAKNNA